MLMYARRILILLKMKSIWLARYRCKFHICFVLVLPTLECYLSCTHLGPFLFHRNDQLSMQRSSRELRDSERGRPRSMPPPSNRGGNGGDYARWGSRDNNFQRRY